MNRIVFLLLMLVGFTVGCTRMEKQVAYVQTDSIVYAVAETAPVHSPDSEDAADDPAIWVNFNDRENSLIIGTDKKAGLYVYDLKGNQKGFYPVGKVNNVDIRYGFPLGSGKTADLVGASNRTDNSLVLFAIDPNTKIFTNLLPEKVFSSLTEVYGFSFYHDRKRNRFFAFVCAKDGNAEQWEILPPAGEKTGMKLIRTFNFGSQTEGLVVDDDLGYLYAAEEDNCIWKIPADPEKDPLKTRIALSDSLNPRIKYDLEGLAILKKNSKKGYLIASVQGNYTYAVFEREGENRYLGSFSIGEDKFDATEDTDGIDVTSENLGEAFPYGILVVQDGFNYDGDSLDSQNFKIIPWEKVSALFTPNLVRKGN
jgi:3-phytase